MDEHGGLVRCRRHSMKIQRQAPDQHATFGFRRQTQTFVPKCRLHKRINRMSIIRSFRTNERSQGPPVCGGRRVKRFWLRGSGVRGSSLNPLNKDLDFVIRDFLLRHLQVRIGVTDCLNQQTAVSMTRDNRGATLAAFLPSTFPVQRQSAADFVRFVRMTFIAAILEDRLDGFPEELFLIGRVG